MRDFKKLIVWEKAHLLCLKIYKIVLSFPEYEKFGMTSQMRRASYSIPFNISEGCGYEINKEFSRFLKFSSGSASEIEYALILAKDLGYIKKEQYQELTAEVITIKKMLYKLRESLK